MALPCRMSNQDVTDFIDYLDNLPRGVLGGENAVDTQLLDTENLKLTGFRVWRR